MKYKGIDISYYQTGLNYLKMSREIDFVIIREGYRKTRDSMFMTHVNGFRNAGLPILGVYHFIYALSEDDARAEAKSCINNVVAAGLPKTTQIWCDFEYDTIDQAEKKGVHLGADEVNSFTIAFCEEIKKAGYPTGFYTNGDYYRNYYDDSVIKKYPVWLADLKESPSYDCLIHQYSWEGKINGYAENLDMDYYFGEIENYGDIENIIDLFPEGDVLEYKRGDKGDGVKSFQKKLQRLGYVIAVDGDFGANCEKVVKEFQSKNGLKVDGIVGINTMKKLNSLGYVNELEVETKNANTVINTLSTTEKAINFMEKIATDDSHGYSQLSRWGNPDYDCSSLTITAWENAGVPVKTSGATYTGNMKEVFLKNGFVDVTDQVNLSTGNGLLRGDVLLNEVHHVAMYCGQGKEVEASVSELGTISGSPGDSTGREILIRSYRNYPWDVILRYNGDGKATDTIIATYKKGSVGSGVKTLQQKLVALGYSLVTDGEFGTATETAVKNFQQKHGLEVDGIVGKSTTAKIDEMLNLINYSKYQEWAGKVTASKLNFRKAPGTSSANVDGLPQLKSGDRVAVCGEKNASDGSNWYYVRTNNGIYGYVSAQYVTRI